MALAGVSAQQERTIEKSIEFTVQMEKDHSTKK